MTVGAFVLYDPWLFDPEARIQVRDTLFYGAAAAAMLAAAFRAWRSRPVVHGASA
jgi:hypothetical protein